MTDDEGRTSRQGIYVSLGFARYAHTRADQLSGAPWRSSTWASRCSRTPTCSRWTSRMPGSTVATAATMATTALVLQATRWPTYVAANILIAITYALVGAWLAKIFGRVGGVFMAFLLPFLDLGIVQNPMLHPTPTTLSRWLPDTAGPRCWSTERSTRRL